MNKIILLAVFIGNPYFILAQDLAPHDEGNYLIRAGQSQTVHTFIRLLEKPDVDSEMLYIDSLFLKERPKYKDSLNMYSRQLIKYLKSAKLSVVIVFPEEVYNTYRCRYFTKKIVFYMDLYLKVANANSLIMKISNKTPEELVLENIELDKRRIKSNQKQEVAPPPQGLN
jgi:hypothetical protein